MDDDDVMQAARKIFSEDYETELKDRGVLPPTRNQHPLYPPWSDTEYEAMERDKAKYFLYYYAVLTAVKDFKDRLADFSEDKLHVMVLGAGRGRLVDYCLDAIHENDVKGLVHVIEINDTANKLLREKYAGNPAVKVYRPVVIRDENEILRAAANNRLEPDLTELTVLKPVRLIVSELFGSFGDNEFVSEILSAATALFGYRDQNNVISCISIPASYTTYACAVSSLSLEEYFKSKPVHLSVLGLPTDTVFLSDLSTLYTCECTCPSPILSSSFILPTPKTDSTVTKVTGFAGYFRAKLYRDIYIDTRPCSSQNTYFWEAAFFSLGKPSEIKRPIKSVKISRKCTRKANYDLLKIRNPLYEMWYEWLVMYNDQNDSVTKIFNEKGSKHKLHL
ncbi:uncharacterized protein LOC101242933 [Ciona intestinalis]